MAIHRDLVAGEIQQMNRKSCLVMYRDIKYPNFNIATFSLRDPFSLHSLLHLL
jgi:hypothetical protein